MTAAAAAAGGAVLANATRLVAGLRSTAKPLHPWGDVWDGRLHRRGSEERTGVAWLDEPGEDDVLVRLSRAVGLPDGWPDVHGLALRVDGPAARPADLLFANTGWAPVTRFLLTAGRHPRSRPMTTLLPYRTTTGPVLLGVRGRTATTYDLSWARPTGPWRPFGTLDLVDQHSDPAHLSFDPLRWQLPGLDQYPSVVRLREPAYLRARRSRSES